MSRWGDLTRRALSGLVLLIVALFCVWVGGYAFLLLIVMACAVLAGEWVAMCGFSWSDPPMFWMSAVLVLAALCDGLGKAWIGLLLVFAGTVAVAMFGPSPRRSLQHRRDPSLQSRHGPARPGHSRQHHAATDELGEPSHDVAGNPTRAARARTRLNLAFGIPYLGLAAIALPWLRADPAVGLANTLFVLAIVWASDIGAYIAGRMVGGPRLAPAISPGKTLSGAAGGLAGAALAGVAVAACFSSGFSSSHVIGLGMALGIISQAGDLVESALKRHFGVKDSGRIIPGHGGLLDRLDALLAVAPVAALLAFTVGRGVVLWR